ncbi:MAG: LysR family transcriptional regulator [Xanthobacteraceae bacterium]|nr:LysR family transcriptional regulator [Xanthobacteraceae bacterium]MBX3534489.1 LysR family transcriptional regulator [Xanthobacteraceae bacterium]MBX3547915.1 LysR family transcriptional regulator [Xanthobacteraceae bacterium]MCW5674659.1 LysR family transcriptional regulator [Xanthobacteraceae bacterium]MCW5677008.1 LysR family transcriptional regulator [Xanthobacteraceae bacterium]
MNVKALKAFRLVVVNGSLAAAAKSLHLSQPAVSRLISLLEHETKLQLFYRTRRRLTLTPEGEAFYRQAEHLLAGFDEIPRIISDIKAKTGGHFRLVTAPRIGQGLVSPALALMQRESPGVRCIVDIQSRFDLENQIGTRRYDLGIVSLPVSHSLIEIDNKPLVRVRAEALLPQDHPLASKTQLSAADLAPFPMLGLWPTQIWRQQMDDFFRSGGAVPSYSIETRSSLMACQMVRDGAGIAILDRLCAQAIDLNGLTLRPIDPERWISFGYIQHRGSTLSQHAEHFLDCVNRVIARLRARDSEYKSAIVPLA